MNLTPELNYLKEEIAEYAREYGLDFFNVVFEAMTFEQMNEVAAFGGFPTRYPHWRFGMEYDYMSKGYAYGLHKIYELVINNDPCYAYLLRSNSPVDQKLVIAHVYAHSDFFKNNYWFSQTSRKMMDEMANHGTRIRKYIERYGHETVEDFVDCCLSLENLIDLHAPFIRRKEEPDRRQAEEENNEAGELKLKSKPYMESFINPPEALRRQREEKKTRDTHRKDSFPAEPEKDVLLFLQKYAPLEPWQRNVLSMLREEAYYFAPQAQTKIMNEGWAAYWHARIMTEKSLTDAEVIDFADHHSGTLSTRPGQLNPYKLGIELFRDIEDRWNKGKFGEEYENCTDREIKQKWNKNLGLGREKIFEVRRIYNDVTFIDTFITPEFCEEQKMFVYAFDKSSGNYVIVDRDFGVVKEKLLFLLTNFGQPYITIIDANYKNRGELYLKHRHESVDLKHGDTVETLKKLGKIWKRPVHIETVLEEKPKLLSFDGKDLVEVNLKS